VAGQSIVSRAVTILVAHGLNEFVIVDGYEGDRLRDVLTVEFPATDFRFVRNPAYASTNNAYSLWLARDAAQGPILLMDSDILFDPAVIRRMLDDGRPNRLALRTRGSLGDEEMKVTLGTRGQITDLSKETPAALAAGESMGIEVFSAAFTTRLFVELERRIAQEGRTGEYYEAAFVALLRAGEEIFPVDLSDLDCLEIDTQEDLELAQRMFGGAPGRGPDRHRDGSS
jgi:choline kinase